MGGETRRCVMRTVFARPFHVGRRGGLTGPAGAGDRSAARRLASLAPAFDLTGTGPGLMRDLEPLEGEANPPDMLFIDSSGANTPRSNADLMVRRGVAP